MMVSGNVTGVPRLLLRLEGAAVLAAAVVVYAVSGAQWWVFAICFLIPDLSMLGYLAGPRVGAGSYNAGHSYLGALLLGGLTYALHWPLGQTFALIWLAHIGFDRLLGYGLKYGEGFGMTHLGRIGKAARG